ncbi:MAG: hypothetical protein DSY60_02030 [Persephonella sp.]|nr:MAG: hypothetical protein DSY60_02030 [Persephonella sp.]
MLPEHYIQLADELLTRKLNTNQITVFKTAIERYYYGSFLMCKDILMNAIYPYREKDLLNKNIHSIVKKVFLNSNIPIVASMLEELKILKNEVEYNPAFIPTKYEVDLAKSYAYEIVSILEELQEEEYKNLRDTYLSLKGIKED